MLVRRLAHCLTAFVVTGVVVTLAACAAGSATIDTPSDPTFVLHGSGGPPPASLQSASFSDPGGVMFSGAASSVTLTLYALYISPNADCSAPVLAQDLGAGEDKDFMTNPVLFATDPAAGSYQCLMLKMSDVLRMRPATAIGSCIAGHEYVGDIYRTGESDWKDVDMSTVTGTGTEEVPANDHVTIFMTRDSSAAIARGISRHQIVVLQSDLVVPGQSTFYFDASHAVASDGTQCGLEKPVASFH